MSTAGSPTLGGPKAATLGKPQSAAMIALAFPPVDPEITPLGSRVLVQLRQAKGKSEGGIILPDQTKDSEKWNTQVALVRALGPVAFCSRTTLDEWPEKKWCEPGDFVRVPKWGGDRFEVPYGTEKALFAIFNDLELIGKVTGDPLKIIAFI